MPAKSKSQQRAAGMALAAKRGEMNVSELKGAAKDMYDSMSKSELEDYAKTDRSKLDENIFEFVYNEPYRIISSTKKDLSEAVFYFKNPHTGEEGIGVSPLKEEETKPNIYPIDKFPGRVAGIVEELVENFSKYDWKNKSLKEGLTITGEYEGEKDDLYLENDYLKDIGDISLSVEDFTRKILMSVTDETSEWPDPEDEKKLSIWWEDNYGDDIMEGFVGGHNVDWKDVVIGNDVLDAMSERDFEKLERWNNSGRVALLDKGDNYIVRIQPGDEEVEQFLEMYTKGNISPYIKESKLNEGVPNLKPFEQVEIGDVAIDYSDEKGEVVDKAVAIIKIGEELGDYQPNIANMEAVEFLKNYDGTGAMSEFFQEAESYADDGDEIEMIAVHNPNFDETVVYTYGYDGAYVPMVNEGINEGIVKDQTIADLIMEISEAVYNLINGDDVDYFPEEDVLLEIENDLQKLFGLSLEDLSDEESILELGLSYDELIRIKEYLVNKGFLNENLNESISFEETSKGEEFLDNLYNTLIDMGLREDEADFFIDKVPMTILDMWFNDYHYEGLSIDEIAKRVRNYKK